jgi:hypothetical protein
VLAWNWLIEDTLLMSERLRESIERLNLEKLKAGDEVHITTGKGERAIRYKFTVQEAGRWPVGHMIEIAPDGQTTGDGVLMLQGSGRWTNRRENPVQKQERAFTSYFCDLSLGTILVGANPNQPANRIIFDKTPDQFISEIFVQESLGPED